MASTGTAAPSTIPASWPAGDQLIVPSGYDMFGQMPGNVLLVFETSDEVEP